MMLKIKTAQAPPKKSFNFHKLTLCHGPEDTNLQLILIFSENVVAYHK